MSLYDATIVPPQPYEVVNEIVTLIQGSAAVNSYAIESADYVYAFEHPADPDKPSKYVVVMERVDLGGRLQTITGHMVAPITVQVVCDRDRANPHQLLSEVHNDIYAALVGQKPVLTKSSMNLGLSREVAPSTPELDAETDEWYSTAVYFAVLNPL